LGSPLLKTSPREDLVILIPDFIFGRCWVSDPEPLPLGPRRWQTPLKAILHGPGTSRFGLLFDQSRSCTRQLYSIPYFDSGGHVTPQNFAGRFSYFLRSPQPGPERNLVAKTTGTEVVGIRYLMQKTGKGCRTTERAKQGDAERAR
ncbi:hypothetical protein ALC60_05516, partial [Trachymyrmex zeteki]